MKPWEDLTEKSRGVELLKLKPESNDLLHLDALRFFAATAVVILHWSESLRVRVPIERQVPLSFLSLAVDLFFIISGIVMFHVYFGRLKDTPSFGRFLQRRVARLYPLHFATFLFMLLFFCAATYLHIHVNHPYEFDFRAILPNLLFLQFFPFVNSLSFNDPSWSIAAEMLCYLTLPAAFYLYRRARFAPAVVAVCIISALTFLCHGWDWTTWMTHNGFFRALPAFLFGITLAGFSPLLTKIPAANVLLAVAAAIFIALGTMDVSRGYLLCMVYLIAALAYAADVQKRSSVLISAAAPFGLLTYSIYMLHRPYQAVAFRFAHLVLHLPDAAFNVYVVLSFLPLLALAYASYMYFETPARRWISSRRIKTKDRVPAQAIPES